MKFESHHIKGRGRAKTLGFPTINLKIPDGLEMDHGIYGAYLTIDGKKYLGALHYGPSPTFNDEYKSCEIFLVNLKDMEAPVTEDKKLQVEIIKFIRGVIKFDKVEDLVKQVNEDIENVKKLSGS